MSYYLVTLNLNWADEMDVFGYSFMDESEVKRFKKLLKSKDDMFSFSIGTNQDIDFENGEECLEYLDFMKIKDDEEYNILQKYFGDNECSISPISLMNTLEEDNEEYFDGETDAEGSYREIYDEDEEDF